MVKGSAKLSYECGLPDSAFSIREGREFCSQCKTSIVDFTEMTDEEIRGYVATQSVSFCVKIHSDQLQRVKARTDDRVGQGRKTSLRQSIAVAATAAFLALAGESNAQVADSVRTEQTENTPVANNSTHVNSASDSSGVAACEEGMTLPEATIKRAPLKKKVFLRLGRREFYVMNRAPFIGSRRKGGWRGKFWVSYRFNYRCFSSKDFVTGKICFSHAA